MAIFKSSNRENLFIETCKNLDVTSLDNALEVGDLFREMEVLCADKYGKKLGAFRIVQSDKSDEESFFIAQIED